MSTPRTLNVPEDSELAQAIEHAASEHAPLIVESGPKTFRLDVVETKTTPPKGSLSPDEIAASRQGILDASGSWSDEDVRALMEDCRERRRSSRPHVVL